MHSKKKCLKKIIETGLGEDYQPGDQNLSSPQLQTIVGIFRKIKYNILRFYKLTKLYKTLTTKATIYYSYYSIHYLLIR